jgi:hypothetical protein
MRYATLKPSPGKNPKPLIDAPPNMCGGKPTDIAKAIKIAHLWVAALRRITVRPSRRLVYRLFLRKRNDISYPLALRSAVGTAFAKFGIENHGWIPRRPRMLV